MARLARVEVFAPEEIAIVHVINRVVRRCFLMGFDPVSQKNYDHRKQWIEARLRLLASCFGIDLLCFSILSNHFHLILRSRPDVVALWDDTEVARRWLTLCPIRKRSDGTAEEPNEFELNSIRNNPIRIKEIRTRLSDIGWWMRLLCQNIAMRANREDSESGKFFQSRYRAVRLCDEEALLACAAYVDLNPIRAAIAEKLEDSLFTSVQRRIEEIQHHLPTEIDDVHDDPPSSMDQSRDRFLSPLTIDELRASIGPCPSQTGFRCSEKGFLSISTIDYIELLDWTARQIATGKRGSTPSHVPPILRRLSLSPEVWSALVQNFGKLFNNVAGRPKTIDMNRSRIRHRRFYLRREARALLETEA